MQPQFLYLLLLLTFGLNAQKKCISDELNTLMLKEAVLPLSSIGRDSVLIIPTVVHIVYNTESQNLSDDEIVAQIERLNLDFANLNPDSLGIAHPFYPKTGKSNIKFCLAKLDEHHNPSNGISRTYTNVANFSLSSNNLRDIHEDSKGGKDGWDPNKFLNIWVCNLGDGVFGFASSPEQALNEAKHDGVVIHHNYFGNHLMHNKGRTLVHEVGHYLGLKHLWGNEFCGDDNIEDTPPQESSNIGCPSFPRNPNNFCGSTNNGEMYMNYMDYTDDDCMVMFTKGQINKMRENIVNYRSGLAKNITCDATASANTLKSNLNLKTYPNPVSSNLYIKGLNEKVTSEIKLYSINGNLVNSYSLVAKSHTLNVQNLNKGLYFLQISTEKSWDNIKVLVQ